MSSLTLTALVSSARCLPLEASSGSTGGSSARRREPLVGAPFAGAPLAGLPLAGVPLVRLPPLTGSAGSAARRRDGIGGTGRAGDDWGVSCSYGAGTERGERVGNDGADALGRGSAGEEIGRGSAADVDRRSASQLSMGRDSVAGPGAGAAR